MLRHDREPSEADLLIIDFRYAFGFGNLDVMVGSEPIADASPGSEHRRGRFPLGQRNDKPHSDKKSAVPS